MVTQRLPCLLWLHRKGHRGRPGPVVEDVRLVGCGHRYSAALPYPNPHPNPNPNPTPDQLLLGAAASASPHARLSAVVWAGRVFPSG